MITQQHLTEIFDYRDGDLYWKRDSNQRPQWNAHFAGRKAGRGTPRGYVHVCFRPSARNGLNKTRHFLLHRLIFCFHRGYYPETVDHINGDASDNRIENLRPAKPHENSANQAPRPGISGFSGVNARKNGTYEVRVSFAKKRHHLGIYNSLEEARLAYAWAAAALKGEWQRSAA